jgi:uncharacterized protein
MALTCGRAFRLLVLIGALHGVFGALAVRAQQPPPALTGPVNDFAGVIDAATEREIERRIRALQAASGDVVVVATVQTFQPYATIEEYALAMFENGGRGIGEKGRDNGALILVAVDDRRARIETGYDLEEFITDGYAGETIRVVMTPRFRSGDYSGGLLQGATRIINRIADRRGVTLADVPQDRPPRQVTRGTGRFPWSTVIFIIVMLILMSRGGGGRGGRRRRGPWSGWNSGVGAFGAGTILGGGFGGYGGRGGGFGGGFGGGGFGGFGGGRSGGGGASGGW